MFDLINETVMFAPAEGFYATKGLERDEVRISYVLKEDSIVSSMNIMKKGLKAYLNR